MSRLAFDHQKSKPTDSIKTQMQQPALRGASARAVALATLRSGGVRAFYRGLGGPLAGSVVFRSLQFGLYSGVVAFCGERSWLRGTLPGTGVEARVLLGGVVAGTVRAAIETPLESFKVRRQLALPFRWRSHALLGLSGNWARTATLLSAFFVLVDVGGRHVPPSIGADPLWGPLFTGGVCATSAWVLCWPFEVVRNCIVSQHNLLDTFLFERGFSSLA